MRICLFEDQHYTKLLPLCYMRPVWDLSCGAETLKERLEKVFKQPIEYCYSPRAAQKLEGEYLFISARVLADTKLLETIRGKDKLYLSEGQVVAFKGNRAELEGALDDPLHRTSALISAKFINYPWDLLIDFKNRRGKTKIEWGAKISNNVVLDDSKGPIYIGEGTIIHPFTILRGPLYIGKHCRIGGEVSSSIIMSYVNKAHYGFLGDSYVCSWVNLGAGTTNSNLKNNYGTVKVYSRGKMIDTKENFIGCFIGDHAKTAIGTLIYTGCVIGVGANIFGVDHVKKFVPSFSWGEKGVIRIDKACETARAVMARRSVEFSSQYDKLFRHAYEEAKNKEKN